jgi:ferredoxin-NADP reductase
VTAPVSSGMRRLGHVITAYEKVSAISGLTRPAVVAVDRDLRVVVTDVRRACDDVVTIRVAAASGDPLPTWDPGAHVDVVLPSGKLRQYSLSGDPADRSSWRIGVRRIADGDGGSIEMHTLRPGQELVLRGPRNAFPFLDVPAYLFVAGGIGITPILPMLRDAARRGADWALVYTGRSRATMPFLDELEALGAPDRLHVWPDDEYGVPDGHRILAAAPSDAAVYCCGPTAMIEAIRAVLPSDLVETLHSERFAPAPVVGGESFEILLAGSDRLIEVRADESALAALQRELPDLAYSCRQGFCRTCVVPVLDGRVEHRDRCLTDAERANGMAVCVSRAAGRLVLDA